MTTDLCDGCRKPLLGHRTVELTGIGTFCFPCHNQTLAEKLGLRFDGSALQPVTLTGPDGRVHAFEIHSFLCPTGHAMEAREVDPSGTEGYEFKILGDFEADALSLFALLYERMRTGLAEESLKPFDGRWRPKGDRLRARVTCHPEGERLPVLVIDGRPFTWDEVGEMLADSEGFELHIQIKDPIEVVGGPLLDRPRR